MVRIFSDSTCDMTKELQEKYGITVIPLHILLGEDEYIDGLNITPKDIFTWADANKTTPKTSAISLDTAVDMFRPVIEAGDEIISFCISETMSTSGQVMRLAAEELDATDKIHVVNSKNLSNGLTLLAIEAAVAAKEGKSADEILAMLDDLIPRVRVSFVVDTLTYLHRGGRCSGLAAMAGGLLKLHPKIVVENGVMHAEKKYRGVIDKATLAYVQDLEEELKNADPKRVFVTHSQDPDKAPQEVVEYLKGFGKFEEIIKSHVGSVISSHCGPGTLGIIFIAGK